MMFMTPNTTINQRCSDDLGTPAAQSTPDNTPTKPRKVRGFKVRKLILPGCEMEDIPKEDINVRAKFRVFDSRCVRQTNDVVLLHKMLHVFNMSSSSLNEDEFDVTQTMTTCIRVRLDELHCQCLECEENRYDVNFSDSF